MYKANAYNTYVENNINIESPEKLIAMMYEGVLRFNAQAKKAIRDEDTEKKVYWIKRSVDVIVELICSLDKKGGAIAEYLEGLYLYQIQLLGQANSDDNMDKIDEVSRVFKGLLEAWKEETNVA